MPREGLFRRRVLNPPNFDQSVHPPADDKLAVWSEANTVHAPGVIAERHDALPGRDVEQLHHTAVHGGAYKGAVGREETTPAPQGMRVNTNRLANLGALPLHFGLVTVYGLGYETWEFVEVRSDNNDTWK